MFYLRIEEEKLCPTPETRILENAELSKGILSVEASLLKFCLKYEIWCIVIENQERTLD
jgi:hypothetical protein